MMMGSNANAVMGEATNEAQSIVDDAINVVGAFCEMDSQEVVVPLGANRDAGVFVDALLRKWSSDPATSVSVHLDDIKSFLSKSLTIVNARIATEAKSSSMTVAADARGQLSFSQADVQMFEPRGRFKLELASDCLIIEGKSGSGVVSYDDIVNVTVLPSPTTAKKEGEDLLVLTFDHPLKICGKDMLYLLFNLSKTLPKGVLESTETESSRIVSAVQSALDMKVNIPNDRIYRTFSGKKSFLHCHHGKQEGAVYLLYCGVFFIKPTLFIHVDEIHSIKAGRDGSASTRFIDLEVETVDKKKYSFSNIDREELGGIERYVKGYVEVRKRKKEEKEALEQGRALPAPVVEEDDGDDSDDSDYRSGESEKESDSSSSDDENDKSESEVDESRPQNRLKRQHSSKNNALYARKKS